MPGTLPGVYMKNLPRHDPRILQINNRLGDVTHLPYVPNRVHLPQRSMAFLAMHRPLDDPLAYRIHSDTPLGIFDRQ